MPELPEVEVVARQLKPCLVGCRVVGIRILDGLLRSERTPRLRGRRIDDVYRSGKRVLLRFSPAGRSAPLWLAVHLRMTGRLIWRAATVCADRRHLRARIDLDRGSLLFIDTRRFGTWSWYRSARAALPDGVDPLSPELSLDRMAELIGPGRQNIKAWLLRQDRLVGLGNIYVSEILHASRVSPFREARTLTRADLERLRGSTRRILRRAIDNCGTTFSDFQDSRGMTGSYQHYLAVYAREGRPCRRCRTSIQRIVQQQRSTFHCPTCQR